MLETKLRMSAKAAIYCTETEIQWCAQKIIDPPHVFLIQEDHSGCCLWAGTGLSVTVQDMSFLLFCISSFFLGSLPLSTENLLSLYFLKADPCLFLEPFCSIFCELLEDVVSSSSSQLPLKTNYLIQSTAVEFYDFPLYPDLEKDYILPCQKMLNLTCPERSLVTLQFL